MNNKMIEKTKLLDANGNLKNAGYATEMLFDYTRNDVKVNKLKLKEWDYYLMYNEFYAVALTVADNGYMGLLSASFIDFTKKTEKTSTVMTFMPKGKFQMPSTSKTGNVHFENSRLKYDFINKNGKRQIKIIFLNFDKNKTLTAVFDLNNEPTESMVIATPFEKPHQFYLNQKIVGFTCKGVVTYDQTNIEFAENNSYAILDWGRGVWPYKNSWYWASACGKVGKDMFGFNFGYGFGNTTSATENMLFLNGKSIKLNEVKFEIESNKKGKPEFLKNWKITDNENKVNLTFTPILNRHSYSSALIISSKQNQVFGLYNGTIQLTNGKNLKIEKFLGFAEKVDNKW